MRLISFRPNAAITIPGIASGSTFTIEPGVGAFKGWRAHVRGPRIYLVSPRGWVPGQVATGTGPSTIYDIAREMCTIKWEGDEADIDGLAKWSPPAEVREAPSRVATVEDADPVAKEFIAPPAPPVAAQPTIDEDEEPDDAPPPEWGGKAKPDNSKSKEKRK